MLPTHNIPLLPSSDIDLALPADHQSRAAHSAHLLKKLGYRIDDTVMTLGEPEWFSVNLAMHGITNSRKLPATWAHIFVESVGELKAIIEDLDLQAVEKGIWLSWPRKNSGVKTDVYEQTLRDTMLPRGWVDTKICTVDQNWSALKFYRRKVQSKP